MGKHGPCCHCGVTTTPLWRNGPPDKPVLCNACGSRWRTKGSLTNYTPLHARDLIDSEEYKVPKVKSFSIKPKEKNLIKIKQAGYALENKREMPYSDQNFRKFLEVDTSNRSSSGSAISYSESCAQFGPTEASDVTGSAQSNVCKPLVPSKKRTCVARVKPSPVEKLTRDLYSIWHEQQSSCRSSTEEDLLYSRPITMGSVEIRSGSVLLRYPNSRSVDDESEASSLSRDNKSYMTYETHSGSASFPKKPAAHAVQEHAKRDKSSSGKLHLLQDIDSPLGFTDLKDVNCKQDIGGKGLATGPDILEHSRLTTLKRTLDIQNQHVPEPIGNARSPKRVKSKPNSNDEDSQFIHDYDSFVNNNSSCISPRCFLATPMLRSLQFSKDSSDRDSLLDVPCNTSFPNADLLCHPRNRAPGVTNNSP